MGKEINAEQTRQKIARKLGREGDGRSLPSSLAMFSTSAHKISFSTISEPETGYQLGSQRARLETSPVLMLLCYNVAVQRRSSSDVPRRLMLPRFRTQDSSPDSTFYIVC